MLIVSSHVHFTPLKEPGCTGIIITLELHRVKERDEERRLCKRWRVMNKRQTEVPPFPPLWLVFTKDSWSLCDVLQSLQISYEKN